ncbi:MAG TPA: substrate-binding domain-containing protein [Candidatus Limnocylindria bacterium]|nr:substrate-binding domain-containing protein [Candidatus Limnocylindria bacterium]
MRTLVRVAAAALALSGCAGSSSPAADPLAGTYTAVVSESAVPLAERLTAAFASGHPGMTWAVKEVGSSATIALLYGRDADVGFVSRDLTVQDRTLVQAIGLGYTAQVLIVHPSNPVANLSGTQLRGIFSGAIKDWSEVGGNAGPILVILRSESSPTRTTLDPLLRTASSPYRADAILTPDASAMLSAVSASPRAIGMVSALHLLGLTSGPRAIGVDGVMPTRPNTVGGAYPYRRPISLVLPLNTYLIRPGAKAFLEFVHGEEGLRILREFF